MRIEITPEEAAFLQQILRRDYQELREEIYKTEDFKFKADLRQQERIVESLLNKIAPAENVKSA